MVPDELWELVAPLLQSFAARPQGGGTVPCDERAVFTTVVYALTSGCAWRHLPPTFGTSPATAHRRFTVWTEAGTSRAEQGLLLAQYAERAAAADEAQQRARAEADAARHEAWQTLRGSRCADLFADQAPPTRRRASSPSCGTDWPRCGPNSPRSPSGSTPSASRPCGSCAARSSSCGPASRNSAASRRACGPSSGCAERSPTRPRTSTPGRTPPATLPCVTGTARPPTGIATGCGATGRRRARCPHHTVDGSTDLGS
ncbi:transposase [Streptomyces sp. GC420]|nr:transposase [Streptomyces sp. GC420]